MEEKILNKLLTIYQVSNAKIVDGNNTQVVLQVGENQMNGFCASVIFIHEILANREMTLKPLDIALLHHWLSFCTIELFHCSNMQDLYQSLEYLNKELLNRPYLCGFTESIADVVLFEAIKPFVSQWTYQTKEHYINISRWFSNMICSRTLQTPKDINFSRTLLYTENFISQIKI